jgi:hypothetical protein
MFGFLSAAPELGVGESAAATDPTTPRSAAVAISSDKLLWIKFLFIFCFVLHFDVGQEIDAGCATGGSRGHGHFLLNVCSTLTVPLRTATSSVIFKRSSKVHLEFWHFSKNPQSTAVCLAVRSWGN